MTELTAGPEMDAEISIRVMGNDLRVSRTTALARVGSRYIAVTGRVFRLTTGHDVPIPDHLPVLATDRNGNDRYMRYVAEWLIANGHPKVDAEVDAYREPAPNYSTDIAVAWRIVERFMSADDDDASRRFFVEISLDREAWVDSDHVCHVTIVPQDCSDRFVGVAATLPLAICRAALAAVSSASLTPQRAAPPEAGKQG